MLISHRFKFIYTKTVKTAGTSVESYFERFCLPEGQWTQERAREEQESAAGIIGYRGDGKPEKRKWFNHMPAALIRRQIGEPVWNEYFKFCVIRNPFEKAISAFDHFGKNHALRRGVRGLWFRLRHSSGTPEQLRFLHWLSRGNLPMDRDKYVIDSKLCLDDHIRYESLEAGLQRICQRLGVPWEPALLPKFKTGMRRPDSTAATLYTPAALRLVERAYAFELEQFGYTRPDATVH